MIISVPLRRKECLMIPHTENPKDYQKSIGLIKEFSKITGYKNKYTKIHYISIHNKAAEREIEKIIPFTIAPKIIKYLELGTPGWLSQLSVCLWLRS